MHKSEQDTSIIITLCLQTETTVCSRFYPQKNDYALRTSKGEMIAGQNPVMEPRLHILTKVSRISHET